MMAAGVPNCRAYDPAFASELAVILDHGARCMLERSEDVFYYITVMNESYAQPSLPAGAADGIVRGMYRHLAAGERAPDIRLLGSGAILREVIAAAEMLAQEFQVLAEVWSVTSFSELARNARETQRSNRLNPTSPQRLSYVEECLQGAAPVVAASDYVSAYPCLIAPFVHAPYVALGTDGFGRSDTRATLRRFFEVDRQNVVIAALQSLADVGVVPRASVAEAIERYGLDSQVAAPWTR
jgi:pyruvate dehydrogenase E1 component